MRDQEQSLRDFYALMNANGLAQVYHQALACGIFQTLAQESHTADALADACGLCRRPTELLLDVLAAAGLVRQAGAAWSLAALGKMLFGNAEAGAMAGGYRTLGDPYWAHLPAFLKSDQPMAEMDDHAQSAGHYQQQAEALAWMSAPAAREAAPLLCKLAGAAAGGPARVLDLGAGSAIWSLTLAQTCAGAEVTAVDWPAVLPVAEKFAALMGVGERLRLLAGNYHEVPFHTLDAAGFDLAIVANVTHLETEAGNRVLFARTREALKPGGWLAIIDVMAAGRESREASPANGRCETEDSGSYANYPTAALYALGLALRTRRARIFSRGELKALLVGAGYGAIWGPHVLGADPQILGILAGQAR